MSFESIQEITPPLAWEQLKADPTVLILDVREEWEYEIVHLPQSVLYPLGKLLATSKEDLLEDIPQLKQAPQIMTLCHHGIRSKQGAAWLAQNGFSVQSIRGGIQAWADEVERTLPTY